MPAPDIFVDAGAWIALSDRSDQHHRVASEAYRQLLQRARLLVTTHLVVAEAHVLIRRAAGHNAALQFLRSLRQSGRVLIVYSDAVLHAEAEEILARYADQDFSLADAVSFAVMRKRNIPEAFAFDRHFLVAGFILVPARP